MRGRYSSLSLQTHAGVRTISESQQRLSSSILLSLFKCKQNLMFSPVNRVVEDDWLTDCLADHSVC